MAYVQFINFNFSPTLLISKYTGILCVRSDINLKCFLTSKEPHELTSSKDQDLFSLFVLYPKK